MLSEGFYKLFDLFFFLSKKEKVKSDLYTNMIKAGSHIFFSLQ